MEGNGHLGYRQLNRTEDKLWGIYGAYDYRRNHLKNYYQQLTCGGEFWYKSWFLGGNLYYLIDKKHYLIGEEPQEVHTATLRDSTKRSRRRDRLCMER